MRNDLQEWEESLEPYFGHIKLLGEIPITHIELELLSQQIREHIKRHGPTKTTRKFETDYCRAFAVFLASIAAHNTDREYWRIVSEAVGISIQRIFELHWGEIFLGTLREFGLPTFQDVGGYRFVTPIRLHGGIPAYSLPDFFAYILWPSVKKDAYKGLSTEELVPILLKKSTVQIAVDSPVTNFLDNGGEYAIEFLDRCRKMARLFNQSQEVPDLDEVELPPYVIRNFKQWVDEELETDKGRRLRAPRLYLDPWGPDFHLYLPPESVEGLLATRSYFWRVEIPGKDKNYEHTERVRVRRRGYDLETSEVQFPIENPSQRIIVSYCCQDAPTDETESQKTFTLRRWRIDLLPIGGQLPLMAFNPDDGRVLRWGQTLPAQELWLIFPGEVELQVEGEGRAIEYFPQMNGLFGQWNIQAWDLHKAHSVRLMKNGKTFRAPVPVLSAPPDPVLVGSNLLSSNVDPDEVPLYIGSPPWVRIPIRPGRSVESELDCWHFNLESRWTASPAFHNEIFQLPNLPFRREQELNAVDVPLSSILGDQACGTYRVVATGPYNIRTEIRFRVWPELTIKDLECYYLPCQKGAQKVTFLLGLSEGCDVMPQAGIEGVSVSVRERDFLVTVDPDKTVADLHLIKHLNTGDTIRMPLALGLPRLRWSLSLGQEDSEIIWNALPIKSTVDALLQAGQSTIFFDFPLIDELPLVFNIHLRNPESGDLLQEHIRLQKVRFRQTRWRFSLGEFTDTIRGLDELPVFEFQLAIQNVQTGELLTLPVIRLRRELDIQDVQIDFLSESEFRIHWIEPKPLRNRRVQIWSEWQPWLAPIEIKIPDEARGELQVRDTNLPPSYYRLHFFTAASWEDKDISLLPPRESHLVKSITPTEMLQWIDERVTAQPNHYLLHFFRACVLEADKRSAGSDKEIQWCYQNLDKAKPKTILAFQSWLGGNPQDTDHPRDLNTQKAVRISMFRPQYLQHLLESHQKGDQVFNSYLDIFTLTPLIMPESALLIIDHDDDPARIMHSLQILVKRQSPKVLLRIVDLIEKGQLSDTDAGELLTLNPDFALPTLVDIPESRVKLRLINLVAKLIPDQVYIVLQGFWIRTNAGWGRIEKIISQVEGKELTYFYRKVDKPLLLVTLRPDNYPERIEVDLATRTITFLDAKNVYICIKDNCNYFASKEIRFLRNEHNSASHNGIGPAFYPSASTFHGQKLEEYSIAPPEDQFE